MVECGECGKTFESDDALEQHKQNYDHSKLQECPDCGDTFTATEAYRDHRKTHRNAVQAFVATAGKIHLAAGVVLALLVAGAFLGFPGITGGIANGSADGPTVNGSDRPGQSYPIQGRQHVRPGQSHPDYNSNPPTSGWHYRKPANWGFYTRQLQDERVVHNIEHGGIWISYTSAVNRTVLDKLRTIAHQYPKSVVVTKRDANDAPIAAASWGQLMELQQFDRQRIITFIDANMNNSPEPFAGR